VAGRLRCGFGVSRDVARFGSAIVREDGFEPVPARRSVIDGTGKLDAQ
jgi:hypothetical protein